MIERRYVSEIFTIRNTEKKRFNFQGSRLLALYQFISIILFKKKKKSSNAKWFDTRKKEGIVIRESTLSSSRSAFWEFLEIRGTQNMKNSNFPFFNFFLGRKEVSKQFWNVRNENSFNCLFINNFCFNGKKFKRVRDVDSFWT